MTRHTFVAAVDARVHRAGDVHEQENVKREPEAREPQRTRAALNLVLKDAITEGLELRHCCRWRRRRAAIGVLPGRSVEANRLDTGDTLQIGAIFERLFKLLVEFSAPTNIQPVRSSRREKIVARRCRPSRT